MHNFDGVVFKLQMAFCCSCRLWLEVGCGLTGNDLSIVA
jgi:hypothetical protein